MFYVLCLRSRYQYVYQDLCLSLKSSRNRSMFLLLKFQTTGNGNSCEEFLVGVQVLTLTAFNRVNISWSRCCKPSSLLSLICPFRTLITQGSVLGPILIIKYTKPLLSFNFTLYQINPLLMTLSCIPAVLLLRHTLLSTASKIAFQIQDYGWPTVSQN